MVLVFTPIGATSRPAAGVLAGLFDPVAVGGGLLVSLASGAPLRPPPKPATSGHHGAGLSGADLPQDRNQPAEPTQFAQERRRHPAALTARLISPRTVSAKQHPAHFQRAIPAIAAPCQTRYSPRPP